MSWLRRYRAPAIVLALAMAMLQGHSLSARRSWSVTVDETCMLALAVNSSALGALDPHMFAYGTAPLPIILQWLPAAIAYDLPHRTVYWSGQAEDPELVDNARLVTSLIVGNGLLIAVFVWLFARRGLFWAGIGAFLTACSPMWIAHSSLATTDALATLMWLLCAAAFAFACHKWSVQRCMLAGAACGMAISAKYSAIALVPVFAGLGFFAYGNHPRRIKSQNPAGTWTENLLAGIGFLATAFLVSWGCHGFAMATLANAFGNPSSAGWLEVFDGVQVPAPLAAILNQYTHNERGHPAMLFGEVKLGGWWYYFPVVAFLKSTPAEMLLVLCGVLSALWEVALGRWLSDQRERSQSATTGSSIDNHARQETQSDARARIAAAPVVWAIVLLVGAACLLTIRVQIGYRYALPLLPFALLLCLDQIASFTHRCSNSGLVLKISIGLCILQGCSAYAASPNYLSYATPLAGGGRNAFRYMADSNVDWGQDLPALREVLGDLQADEQRVALCYFGTALPEAYGVRCVEINALDELREGQFDYLAISISRLYGIKATDPTIDVAFRRLLSSEPIASAGDSILIFSAAGLGR